MQYEKWSLGYWTLKQYVRFIDWIIHNKTVMNGLNNIPKDKPILLVPNHQNAVDDPLAILLHTKFQPVWLARADIFKNKTAAIILRFLKIMPVYRWRDGKDELSKNDKTFASSIKVLQSNGMLALFPEATHTGKRQMISHKKAAPRIVFMAEEKTDQNLDIQILPTGIYYSNYWKFNRNLLVNFGEPIPVKKFLKEYGENPNAASLTMRNSIYEGIDPLIINIRSKNHYNDFELITKIYGNHFLARQNKKHSLINLFYSNQKLAKKLDALEIENQDKIESVIKDTKTYNSELKRKKLRNWLIEKPSNNLPKIILNKLILLFGLPIFVFGFLLNAIPFFAIDTFVRKKMRDKTFWSSFFLALGMVVFPVLYLVEFLALSWLISGIWLKLAFLVSLPLTGKIAFKWYILARKTTGRIRLFWLKSFREKEYNQLLIKREKLFNDIDQLISTEI